MTPRAVIVTAVLATARLARAEHVGDDEPIPSKARSLAETGRNAHEHGDYARAIAAFKEAYVIAPSPALLFNLAQAYRLQGNCDDASMMYRRYLASGPSDESRAIAQTHLETVERCIHQRALNIPLDEAYLATKHPPQDLGVVDEPAAPRRAVIERDVGIGLVIGGSAAVAVAAYEGWQAHAAERDVERGYANGVKFKDLAARQAEGERAATAARWAGFGGGAALVTGITLYVIGKRTGVPLAITPTGNGARVSLSWRL